MTDSDRRFPMVHLALGAIGIALLTVIVVRCTHRRDASAITLASEPASAAATIAGPPQPRTTAQSNTVQILAGCQPHLGLAPSTVPSFEVTDRYNMAAIKLKVRFWVNADGFVTRAFVAGFTVVTAADQQAELDFVQHLTFTVPNTEECRVRPLEMIANFSESRQAGEEWATILEIHPLYSFEGSQVVTRP